MIYIVILILAFILFLVLLILFIFRDRCSIHQYYGDGPPQTNCSRCARVWANTVYNRLSKCDNCGYRGLAKGVSCKSCGRVDGYHIFWDK